MTPLRCTALAALALLPVATVALAQPVSAPQSHVAERTPQLTADRTAVKPGETLTLRGHGFPHNAHLALMAGPPDGEAERIGGAQTGRRGSFTAKIQVRARSSAGPFVALACFGGCGVKASTRFRIVTP